MFLVLLGVAFPGVRNHVRAASLLLRASGSHGVLARLDQRPITTQDLWVPSPQGPIRARLYRPTGTGRYRGLVLAHGVHFRGMDEPRLIAFARNLAQSGLVVLTPQLDALADYQVQASSVDALRAAVTLLATRPEVSSGGVGVMGLSFSGGLALRAASDRALRGSVAYVVSIGGHHDLYRVLRYLATDTLTTPDGDRHVHAHDYGLIVFFYAYADRFVHDNGLPAFRDALRTLLHEDRAGALRIAAGIPGESRALLDRIAAHDKVALRPAVEQVLMDLRADLASASPAGHLGGLTVPVYLLHGTGDDVIPAAESRFAALELAAHGNVHLLVTPVIKHVSVEGHPTAWQQWQVVHFMAGIVGE